MNKPDIAVIGGGIAGLAALEHITRVAPDVHVTLLESSGRLGGHIRTDVQDGFVMEAGPDVLLASKQAAIEFAKRVGLGGRLQSTNPDVRGSYILSDSRLRRVPDGMTGLIPSRLGPFIRTSVLSPLAKLRVALEYVIPPRYDDADESIEQFVVRRLGRQMYSRLVEPLLSGISAGDGAKLSVAALFPHLREYERRHGGLIRGMLAQRRRTADPSARSPFVSFPGGLEELVRGAVSVIDQRSHASSRIEVRLSDGAHSITALHDPGRSMRYVLALNSGDCLTADAIILATPAFVSSAIVRPLDTTLSQALGAIEYTPAATISLAYETRDVPRPLDATGYAVPRREERPVVACTWTSAKFTGRAPAGRSLFRVFLGGAGRANPQGLGDTRLLEIAQGELRAVLGVSATPLLARINRFDSALPQYTIGHRQRVAHISTAVARLRGLELAGAAYWGVGIPDCVQSGIDAASRALTTIRSLRPSLRAS